MALALAERRLLDLHHNLAGFVKVHDLIAHLPGRDGAAEVEPFVHSLHVYGVFQACHCHVPCIKRYHECIK